MLSVTEKVKYNEAISADLKKHSDDRDSTNDATFFAAIVSDNGKNQVVSAEVQGSKSSLTQLFLQLLQVPDCPKIVKQSIFTAVANSLTDFDKDGQMIGTALGLWIEDTFGHIDCDCERCKPKKPFKNN